MRQLHSDLAPVLAIVAGGALGAAASGLAASAFILSTPPEPVVVVAPALEAPPPTDVPTPKQPRYTSAPSVLNIGDVRRAMFEVFPESVRDGDARGTTRVDFFVGERGGVQEFRIARTSGNRDVDEAALAVANVFLFSPALDGVRPVAAWYERELTFRMRSIDGRPALSVSAGLPHAP